MKPFNLLDEPWLPVRWVPDVDPARNAPPMVGLRDALIRAHDIAELATNNPLETIALNRLLAGLVASVFPGMVDEADWVQLWEQGYFDPTRCDAYFAKYADRFDLFSPTRPFFGNLVTDAKELSPLSRLLHASASGNNAVLFSHDLDNQSAPMSAAAAARALVCTQAAALGGGVAQPFNLSHAPLIGGAFFWIRGTIDDAPSLFRALLLNLSPTAEVWGPGNASPTWELQTSPSPQKRQVDSVRDLFTFQSRRLQLMLDSQDQVTGVRYNQGSKIEKLLFDDPHLAYRSGKEGLFPLRFNAGRALWQDSTIYMMHEGGADGHAPRTLNWLSRRKLRQLGLDARTAFAVDVFGLVNDQAKIELWRHERVTVYPDIITDLTRWTTLDAMLRLASNDPTKNGMAFRLREATRAFAMRARLNKSWGTRLGDVERADRDAYVQMLDTDSRYWLTLGSRFDYFLERVATTPHDALDTVQRDWRTFLWQAAQSALTTALQSLAQDARTWQAMADADMMLRHGTLYPKRTESTNKPKSASV